LGVELRTGRIVGEWGGEVDSEGMGMGISRTERCWDWQGLGREGEGWKEERECEGEVVYIGRTGQSNFTLKIEREITKKKERF
jgi:hypothetical protein